MPNMSDLPVDPANPGIIFFPEIITLQSLSEPVAIGEHARLERADDVIRNRLKELLHPYIQIRRLFGINPWEYEELPGQQGSTVFKPILDPSQHQFWVIRYWRKLYDKPLMQALELADPGLTPVAALFKPLEDMSGTVETHAIINWLDDNLHAKRGDLGSAQTAEITRTTQLLINFESNSDTTLDFISKAINEFSDLKRVSKRMPIYVVGLFSIIELLLTTQQDKTTENSLSHQLKEKLTLIGNRFQEQVILTSYFPIATDSFKSLITKLYSYRSKVAHGAIIEFNRGDMQGLGNHASVCEFLHALVRKLLLQAINEPVLFRDLKRC